MADGTWLEYSQLVLQTLQDHKGILKDMNKELNEIRSEISALKVKSGMWGAIGGLIPVLLGILYAVLAGVIGK